MAHPESLEARLRRALTVDFARLPSGIDMSERAVAERLRDACAMSRVCLALLPRR